MSDLPTGPGAVGGKTSSSRSPRATQAEMHRRESAIAKLLTKQGPMDLYAIASQTKLTVPQTTNVLTRLMDLGKVQIGDKDAKRNLYEVANGKATRAKRLPPVSTEDIIAKMHLGDTVKVVGLRMDDETPCLDLRYANKDFTVALVA